MADDPTIDNGSLTDYTVRATETAGGDYIQHVRIDVGAGSAESVAAGALPVSGTVTANLGTVAGLATESTLSTLNSKVTAVNTGAVVVSSSALPSGAATAANQLPDGHNVTISGSATVSGSVTANAGTNLNTSALALEAGNLATIAGKDFATQTTLAALDAKVTAVNTGAVTISAALPAGTNNIGDVDVLTLPTLNVNNVSGTVSLPTDAATQTTLAALNAKVTACNTGAVVVSSSALPTDAATQTTLAALNTKVPSQGQALMAASVPVTMASNQTNMPVNVVQQGGVAITLNTGVRDAGTQRVTIATNDTLATVTTVGTVTNITNQGQLVDNAAFSDGTTRLNMAGFIFDEVAGTALTENDGAAARIDSKRAVVFTLEDATTRGRRAVISATGALSVDAAVTSFSTIGTGSTNVTTAGTRVVLAGSTACKKVVICAKAANTGTIWIGGSTVAAGSGIPLVALQQIEMDIANLNTINIDATVNGEGVTYLHYN